MKFRGIFFFIFLLSVNSFAQSECGSQDLHDFKMRSDVSYAQDFIDRQELLADQQRNGLPAAGLHTIPIVVHIFHLGEPEGMGSNISDAQIHEAVQGLNDRFTNMPGFGVNMDVQFCLATKDPNGCSTDGINRIDASTIPGYSSHGIDFPDDFNCGGTPDPDLKAMSTWPVLEYYNIWVVHTICEGWGGYAYFPWGESVDGTVIIDSEMNAWSHVLAHELGHGFNLAHTFNGDAGETCPTNGDCLMEGDYVCDTPPHRVGDCGDSNPCTPEGIWSNSRSNIMSYCWPVDRFTQGQKDRVLASLLYYPRADLLNSQGCTPSDFNTTFEVQHPSCFGDCNGNASAFPGCPGTYEYVWSTGDNASALTGLCPGDYNLTITDANGNQYSFTQSITEAEALILETQNNYATCIGNAVQLNVSGAAFYQWTPEEGLSDPAAGNPIAEPLNTTTYNIVGIDEEGCFGTATLTVNVLEYPNAEIIDIDGSLMAFPSGMSYQWYLNGEEIEGATSSMIEITEFGIYQVEVTNGGLCSSLSQEYLLVGTDNLLNSEIDICLFPNPSSGVFVIHTPDSGKGGKASLFDASGRLVHMEDSLLPGKNEIRCTLEEGVYPLVIQYDGRITTKRLVVVE